MRNVALTDLQRLGLGWHDSGQAALSGPLLSTLDTLDRWIVDLSRAWDAAEYRFPAFVNASELHKLDYFRSFPHLVSFPAALSPSEPNIERFTTGAVLEGDEVRLTELAPVRHALTPAACYHVYIELQRTAATAPRYVTTRNTCFRRERQYLPLQRQSAFSMREIVCIGTLGDVRDFLDLARAHVDCLLDALGLPVSWESATDPFFQPTKNAKYLAQLTSPLKTEAVYGGELAIASLNLHHDHFGRTFDIALRGEPAVTGCIAFGLERWLYALAAEHGPASESWPALPKLRRVEVST